MKVTIVIVDYAITFILSSSLNILGCGCSIVVVMHTLHDQKIMASSTLRLLVTNYMIGLTFSLIQGATNIKF